VDLVEWVIGRRRALDDALARSAREAGLRKLKPNDRAFARMMAATALRRHGQIAAVLAAFMERPLEDAPHATAILHVAATQLLFLGTPAHAAVNIAVEQARANPSSERFERLINALLRRVHLEGSALVGAQDPVSLNIPDWMLRRWTATYGAERARQIAEASLAEAPLDLSVKSDPERWAKELGGEVLPTGTVRLAGGGRIDAMPGFADGAWWVQDAAAALPARFLGDVANLRVADLCAAPGGKTLELAARGAKVTAVDSSWTRADRIRQNLARVRLDADVLVADVMTWAPPEPFDGVLLDVPCTATGTIRRHPDILHLKRESDIAKLASQQADLLRAAARVLRPGGLLVYCSCSLEPEEGSEQIGRFLAASTTMEAVPITADEIGGLTDCLTPRGYLRTLPSHLDRGNPAQSGLDGFFAARLRRMA
jgi:16S rRNA (cytosine967-C5)-methyltransferase